LKPGGIQNERMAYLEKVLRSGAVYKGEIFLDVQEFDRAADYVEAARHGDKLGTKVSLELAAALIERGDALWGPLQKYIVEFLRNPKAPTRRSGRKASQLANRNWVIHYVIAMIVGRSEIPATRNDASKGKRASAASIVREALEKGAGLNLTEEAVNKIWAGSGSWKTGAKAIGKNRRD
jgi:hypothetical protein